METFFCRSNLSESTIYVPVLTTTFSEKANEKKYEKAAIEWLQK